MDWQKYFRAKRIEEQMDLIEQIHAQEIAPESNSAFWDAYCFLINREDFKKYLLGVRGELKKEFDEI